jgi:glycosyltransferase involved in cell wall biosynthesis
VTRIVVATSFPVFPPEGGGQLRVFGLYRALAVPLVLEAHNVEADLKAPMLAERAPDLLETVREVEAACCRRAAHVIVCTDADAARLGELYGLPGERAVRVPNGVDPTAVPFTAPAERARRREALGIAARRHAAFVGSWHEPNIVAVRDVLAAAAELPDVRFLVVGGAGLPFAAEPVPANVDLCGQVPRGFVRDVLSVADAALNPMRWGSGTNLKMLDYALAGAPVVSSVFGARGLGMAPGREYLECEPGELAAGLRRLFAEPEAVVAARVEAARAHAATEFSWDAIAARWRAAEPFRALADTVAAAR